jgi:hypothetical protein
MPLTLADIRTATLAARQRTSDNSIGTEVSAGKIRVVRVEYDTKGKAVVTPLSGYTSAGAAIDILNALL